VVDLPHLGLRRDQGNNAGGRQLRGKRYRK
jgi:hypothetical protein